MLCSLKYIERKIQERVIVCQEVWGKIKNIMINKVQDWTMLLNFVCCSTLRIQAAGKEIRTMWKLPVCIVCKLQNVSNIRCLDVFTRNCCKGSSTPWCGLSLLSACLHLLPHQHLQVGQHQLDQPALLHRRPTPPAEHPWRLPPRLPWHGHQHVGSEI